MRQSLVKFTSKRLRRTTRTLYLWFGPCVRGGTRLKSYSDYETYRRIQQEGNRRKINLVFARKAIIAHIARYAESRIGDVQSVLCHGTRNGAEQRWFKTFLPGNPSVLGTEIASTATQFPDTIEWDFHDMKPEWERAWDIIYSNSWDHAFDPPRAFRNWMKCLTDRGLLFLEHSKDHEPAAVDNLDPFGATLSGLSRMINAIEPARWHVVDVITDLPETYDRRIIVIGRVGKDATRQEKRLSL
jgi:hypothetical protein